MRLRVGLLRSTASFSPAVLFSAGEVGAWYDPSDLTTLFQDTAGTTPVTAAGQTVALMRDKSGRGNHATQATVAARPTYAIEPMTGRRNLLTWTEGFDNAAWSKIAATVTPDAVAAPNTTLTADFLAEDGTTAAHGLQRLSAFTVGTTRVAFIYAKAGTRSRIVFGATTTGGLVVTQYVTVDLLNGNILSTIGGGGAVESVGGGWYKISLSSRVVDGSSDRLAVNILRDTDTAPTSYAGTAGLGLYIWGAQGELGSTATAYQRVTTQFDVTEAGVASKSYLFFDGSDDFMLTGTITPGVDKAQVFAGIRKLSDAQPGILVEFSATATANPGSFYISAPESSSASDRYAFAARGTQALGPGQLSKANIGTAPDTAVITGTGDISGDSNIIRRNSVAFAAATTDQGTGNYLAYPLYIGRRGGTTIPFNGNVYGLIVRFSAANMDAATIGTTETWLNQRTGAY